MKDLQERAHEIAKSKGWWDADVNIPEKLALIHAEISEALEDYRKGKMMTSFDGDKPVGFPTELADAIIRIMDLAGYLGINLEAEIIQKMTYNEQRPYRHGGKRA